MNKFYTFLTAFVFFTSLATFSQTYHNLSQGPFRQDWSDTTLIRVADVWDNVPSIIGYIGNDGTTTLAPVNPQTALTMIYSDTIDVIPGIKKPSTTSNGGVGELEIENPTIGLQGSSAADAPNIIIYLNTLNVSAIRVKYNARDVDSSTDNAIQPIALQYRIGTTGDFTDIPEAFIADATDGPSLGVKTTQVNVVLPSVCSNQSQLQLRIITGNAAGNDEWVGIDDIEVLDDASTNVSNLQLKEEDFRVAGMPNGKFSIQLNKSFSSEVSMQILDLSGKLITQKRLVRPVIGQTESINLENYQSGMYILRIQSRAGFYTTKLVR
jgi:hypothetical protein